MRPRRGLRAAATLAGASLIGLTTVNVTIAVYLGTLTVAGLRRSQQSFASTPTHRFLVLVPAHDEAAVISGTLQAFTDLRYPRALFDVHVVADNCSDTTADIVRSHGWHAHERIAPDEPGKGPALNWLFDQLDANLDFDVAVIVDADTVLDPDFLRALDYAFADGAAVAQGFYSVLEPKESAAAGVRFAALACRHHLRPLGRNRIGASCGLYGNGMAFQRSVLRRRRWSGHLVEDAEFQMELLLRDGIRVTYVPAARLEAEMPATLEAATSQNERWERGRIQLARRYVPELIRRFPSARGRRVAYVDAIADHLVPPLSLVVVLHSVGTLASVGAVLATLRGTHDPKFTRRAILHLGTLVVLGAHVMAALRAVSAPRSVYRSLIQTPGMIAWKVGLWTRALRSKNEVTWRRTKRNTEQ